MQGVNGLIPGTGPGMKHAFNSCGITDLYSDISDCFFFHKKYSLANITGMCMSELELLFPKIISFVLCIKL